MLNSAQSPSVDKKGLTNFKQECTDGNPQCDGDGTADGKCTFRVGFCLNVEDDRLAKSGEVLCTPADVAEVRLKKPRPIDRTETDSANGVALRTLLANLGAHTIEGHREDQLIYDSPVANVETCTPLADFEVPIKKKKGKASVKLQFVTSPDGDGRTEKDSDGLKLTCLAAE